MTQKKLIVKGLMITYVESGDGPVVLLLHGWGDNAQTFQSLTSELSTKYRVIAPDLPGFGGSDSPPEAWGLQDYSDILAAFVEKLDVDLYAIGGHSNGGAIAIHSLATKKLNAKRLVLLASAGIRDEYKGRKKVLRLAAKAAKVATYPLPQKTKNKLKRKAYSVVGSDMFVAEHMQETFKRIVTDDVRSDAATLRIPCLLIYGSEDTATPPDFGKQFAQLIQGSWLEIIEGAGHFVHHEAQLRVNVLVRKFLS